MKPKVSVISFSTPAFDNLQQELISSAKQYGIRSFYSFHEQDVTSSSFFKRHKNIFNYARGFGFWLWKPYVILEALKNGSEGDIFFYLDAGCSFINHPAALIATTDKSKNGLLAFDARPLTNAQWTKRDTFINLACDESEFWYANHIIATAIVFKKNDFVVSFMTEWLQACENFSSLSDAPNVHHQPNLPAFIQHREDQSVFSLLVKKHQLETYRNPSKWGNFLKMDAFREVGEYIGYPYGVMDTIHDYSTQPALNSPYGTIFEFNRKQPSIAQKPGLRSKLKGLLNRTWKH